MILSIYLYICTTLTKTLLKQVNNREVVLYISLLSQTYTHFQIPFNKYTSQFHSTIIIKRSIYTHCIIIIIIIIEYEITQSTHVYINPFHYNSLVSVEEKELGWNENSDGVVGLDISM